MYLLKGEPLIPLPLLLTKMLSLNAVSIKSMERKLLQAITTKFSDHLPKNSIGHFSPFVPAYEQRLNPISAFSEKMLFLGAVAMIYTNRKQL